MVLIVASGGLLALSALAARRVRKEAGAAPVQVTPPAPAQVTPPAPVTAGGSAVGALSGAPPPPPMPLRPVTAQPPGLADTAVSIINNITLKAAEQVPVVGEVFKVADLALKKLPVSNDVKEFLTNPLVYQGKIMWEAAQAIAGPIGDAAGAVGGAIGGVVSGLAPQSQAEQYRQAEWHAENDFRIAAEQAQKAGLPPPVVVDVDASAERARPAGSARPGGRRGGNA